MAKYTTHKITPENYYSSEANQAYMSVSQFKDFLNCEAQAMAKINVDYEQPMTTALLVGSYVDAHFEGTLDVFKSQHPEIFKRDGSLKADYVNAEYMIERAERDKLFMKYMSGEKQVIMTGEINGVPFKVKMDSYHKDKAIVDLKTVKDFKSVYDDEIHQRLPFAEYWGYDIQGAVYQEIVRQNTGKTLPFFIAAVTKESEPDIAVISIPQDRLDERIGLVNAMAPYYQSLKKNKDIVPERCEKCDWCKSTKILTEIIDYRDLEV